MGKNTPMHRGAYVEISHIGLHKCGGGGCFLSIPVPLWNDGLPLLQA